MAQDLSTALISAFGGTCINFGKDLPLKFGGSSQMSLSASVYFASLEDAWVAHKDSVLNFGLIGGNRLYASIGGAGKNIQGHPVLAPNSWYQVGLSYDGTRLKIFLDGKEDASGTGWPAADNDRPLYIGLDLQTGFPAPNIQVSHLSIWNTALTPAEMQGLKKVTR